MTDATHHVPDGLLLSYAAGTLPEAFNLLIAVHISLCDTCRAQLGAYDALGGALLEVNAPALMRSGPEAALGRAGDTVPDAPPTTTGSTDDGFPEPLRVAVGGGPDAVRWRPAGGGVRQAILPSAPGATIRLLSIPGGMAMPEHGHGGQEMTLVLQGAFIDGADTFRRGDVEWADAEVDHTPTALPGAPCICLAASDAKLRFKGWLPRLAQPFLRI